MPVFVAKPLLYYMEGKHYEPNAVQVNHPVRASIILLTILDKKGCKSFIAGPAEVASPFSFVLLVPCFDNALKKTLKISLCVAPYLCITLLPPLR